MGIQSHISSVTGDQHIPISAEIDKRGKSSFQELLKLP